MNLNSFLVWILLAVFAAASLGITLLCEDAPRFMRRLKRNTVALAGWVSILLGLVEAIVRALK